MESQDTLNNIEGQALLDKMLVSCFNHFYREKHTPITGSEAQAVVNCTKRLISGNQIFMDNWNQNKPTYNCPEDLSEDDDDEEEDDD